GMRTGARVTSGTFRSYIAGMGKKLMPDPDLEKLVRELNETDAPATSEAPVAGPSPPAQVRDGEPLEALLIEMAQRGASDLLIVAGNPPIFRIGGRLTRADAPS